MTSTSVVTFNEINTGVQFITLSNINSVRDKIISSFHLSQMDSVAILAMDGSNLSSELQKLLETHEYVMGIKKMKVFLSHKGADKSLVRCYKKTLDTLGFDVWLDEDSMPAGTALHRGILQGSKDSCAAIFFITPKKILFICHGNICRSPMAEFVMKDLVKKAGLTSQFHIESAATSREEIGNPVYPPAQRKLAEHGIPCEGHAARQLMNRDYDEYDLLIGMDQTNLRDMYRICGGDYAEKMSLLMDHTARPGDVADPWYTEDFEATWQDVLEGCQGLLKKLITNELLMG